jgi:hypothetical protein
VVVSAIQAGQSEVLSETMLASVLRVVLAFAALVVGAFLL